jgi:hypothetical protein
MVNKNNIENFAVIPLMTAFVFLKGIDFDYYYQLEIERGGFNEFRSKGTYKEYSQSRFL